MTEATERIWGAFSVANERNPAQLHRWRLAISEVLRALPRPDDLVVDLGCGNGALLSRIAEACPRASLAGIDLEPLALEMAKTTLPRARLFEADLNRGDCPAAGDLAGHAGIVVCSEVLEHLTAPDRLLALARRLLRNDGVLIVTVPAGPMNAFDRSIGHVRHYTNGSLESLLRTSGFRVERCYRWGFPFHTLYRIGMQLMPGSVESFSDASMTRPKMALFAALDQLFRLNVRSGAVGRQLVAVASPA